MILGVTWFRRDLEKCMSAEGTHICAAGLFTWGAADEPVLLAWETEARAPRLAARRQRPVNP